MYIYRSVHYGCTTSVLSVAVEDMVVSTDVMSTCQLSESPVVVQLPVVMVNDVNLRAVWFSHQSASID